MYWFFYSFLEEVSVIEHITLDKLFLHLVELICAHGVEVVPLELLLEDGGVHKLPNKGVSASQVVGEDARVLPVFELGSTDLGFDVSHLLLFLTVLMLILLECFSSVSSCHFDYLLNKIN